MPVAEVSDLFAVSCVSAAYCWAVGLYQAQGVPQAAYAARWNGVRCVTAVDCWAAGSSLTGRHDVSLIEHWNRTRWSIAG